MVKKVNIRIKSSWIWIGTLLSRFVGTATFHISRETKNRKQKSAGNQYFTAMLLFHLCAL